MTRADLGKMLAERSLTLQLTDRARLRGRGGLQTDPAYGARPLKQTIQQYVQDPLALNLLEGKFQRGDTISADLDAERGQVVFAKTITAEVVE